MSRRYVVIGNGIAGQTCAEELRARDSECSIVMLAAERHPLYNRVALPRFLRGQVREERVMMRSVEDYRKRGLAIHFETGATEVGGAAGVESLCEDEVTRFSRCNGHLLAETMNGRRVEFDMLTYGVGLDYYVEPTRGTGIELRRGIVTDSRLRTAAPDVYAAGDVAVFYDP